MITYAFLTHPTDTQIRQIIGLYKKAGWWEGPVDNFKLVVKIVKGSHLFRIACDHKKIIGMGRVISDQASDAYIQDVTVHTRYRGRGIGKNIVSDLVLALEKEGISWIGLIAEKGSSGFYNPLGFEEMPDSTPMIKK